jgi:UDP-N-acetyl-2-amino-2-deoxyglucuronate dehydrogenase
MGPIRIGLIGSGGIGGSHLKAIDAVEGCQVVACCDIVESTARAVAEERHIPWFADYHDLLTLDEVEAVAVCTPHYLHHPMVVAGAQAGKHIICEKPMAMTVRECDDMIRAADEAGVVLAVIHQTSATPTMRLARQLIEGGELGDLWQASHLSPGLRTNAYYRTGAWRGTWHQEGGGVLINQKVHDLHSMHFLLGEPAEVYGAVRNVAHDIEVEDVATAQFRFRSGVDLSFQVSNACGAPEGYTQILGDRATLVLGRGAKIGRPSRSARDFVANAAEAWSSPDVTWETLSGPELPYTGHAAMYAAFVPAVREGARPAVTGEDGRASVEMLNGVILSSHTRRPVTFPLDRDEYDGLLRELSGGRWHAS